MKIVIPGAAFNISRTCQIDTEKKFIYIEEMKDGTFRLTVSTGMAVIGSEINAIKIEAEP